MSDTAVEDFPTRMRAARPAKMSTITADFQLRGLLPEIYAMSYAYISRLERGRIAEEDADTVFLAGLARIYGKPLAELSPLAAERARSLSLLLNDTGKGGQWDSSTSPMSLQRTGPGRNRPSGSRPMGRVVGL